MKMLSSIQTTKKIPLHIMAPAKHQDMSMSGHGPKGSGQGGKGGTNSIREQKLGESHMHQLGGLSEVVALQLVIQ